MSSERCLPDRPLPPYTYVPGFAPHPISDPAGHSYGRKPHVTGAPDEQDLRSCPDYLYGVDLFNGGYYWEAHEAWEAVWLAAGRRSPIARFVQGLIKLAAAGVKARERRPEGVQRHAARARALIESARLECHHAAIPGMQIDAALRLCDEFAALDCDAVPRDGSPISLVAARLEC